MSTKPINSQIERIPSKTAALQAVGNSRNTKKWFLKYGPLFNWDNQILASLPVWSDHRVFYDQCIHLAIAEKINTTLLTMPTALSSIISEYTHETEKDRAIARVSQDPDNDYIQDFEDFYTLKNEVPEFRNDSDVVLAAVKHEGDNLKHASERLRNDREIVLAAVKESGSALEYADDDLRNDREIVLAAVKKSGALEYASERLRNDREIVLAAVKVRAFSLQYASDELRGDRKIVLAAVRKSAEALQYASEELQGDQEIVLAAVSQNGKALQYASEELQGDRVVVLTAICGYGLTERRRRMIDIYKQKKAATILRNYPKRCIRNHSFVIGYASQRLQDDPQIIKRVLRKCGKALQLCIEADQPDQKEMLRLQLGRNTWLYDTHEQRFEKVQNNID